jgi:cytidine deaminase
MLTTEKLIELAMAARQQAYAPYSHYQVGAAVLTADGDVITGCNVENASYGAAICAERVALTRAIAQGERKFVAMAVATRNGASPCGMCRQVMAELGPQMTVYLSDEHGQYRTTNVAELLPDSFASNKLFE